MDTNIERYNEYTKIRNEYAIGSYNIVGKRKYGKRVNKKESIFFKCLMRPEHYKYVDEYMDIIPKYCEKTKSLQKGEQNEHNLYHKVWRLGSNCDKDDDFKTFWHNGCFYLAMIYLGYDFKVTRNRHMIFNCRIKKLP
jgi:hypothetical protein